MSHTVTVTRLPDETTDDVEYTIGGEHDYRCETYRECGKAWHRHPKNDDRVGDEWGNARVGEHKWIEGVWMVSEPAGCGFRYAFEADNPEFQMTELGTYDVAVEWDGGWWVADLALRPVTPVQEGNATAESGNHPSPIENGEKR